MKFLKKMYLCKKKTNNYSMIFSASFENVDLVCRDIEEFLSHQGLLPLSFVVELGARESINNAIAHGSRRDSDKKIKFKIYQHKNHLHMETVDQGKGFAPVFRKYSGRTAPSESGRGLTILYKYFDSVILNGNGNKIMLTLNIREAQREQTKNTE